MLGYRIIFGVTVINILIFYIYHYSITSILCQGYTKQKSIHSKTNSEIFIHIMLCIWFNLFFCVPFLFYFNVNLLIFNRNQFIGCDLLKYGLYLWIFMDF
eukprot:790639_1